MRLQYDCQMPARLRFFQKKDVFFAKIGPAQIDEVDVQVSREALVQAARRHHAELDQCFADLAAVFLLVCYRLFELLLGDNAGTHEKLAETDFLLAARLLGEEPHCRIEHVFGRFGFTHMP